MRCTLENYQPYLLSEVPESFSTVGVKYKLKHIKWCVDVDVQEKTSFKAKTQEGDCALSWERSYWGLM